jgi:hypothetical protein
MGDSDIYQFLVFVAPADSFVQAIELGNNYFERVLRIERRSRTNSSLG